MDSNAQHFQSTSQWNNEWAFRFAGFLYPNAAGAKHRSIVSLADWFGRASCAWYLSYRVVQKEQAECLKIRFHGN